MAVFTDNLEVVDFLQRQVFYEIPLFGKPDSERSLPVYEAKITRDLVGRRYLTEQIEAEEIKLQLTWADLQTPRILAGPPHALGPPFKISGVMIPAAGFKILVNGVSAKGSFDAGPKEGGLQMPPAFVLLSTIWSQPNQQVTSKK